MANAVEPSHKEGLPNVNDAFLIPHGAAPGLPVRTHVGFRLGKVAGQLRLLFEPLLATRVGVSMQGFKEIVFKC